MFIGIDIGTTNVKAVAMNSAGAMYASAERRSTTLIPQAGWSEQEPELLFQLVLSVLDELLLQAPLAGHMEAIEGIAFSSAMHGVVAVDVYGRPLTNMMLWSDLRADAVACELMQRGGAGPEIYQRSGVPIHAMSPLCKLIWLRKNQPELFKNTYQFLGIKEYVWHRLTGKFETDLSCASATGLLHIWNNEWDAETLALAGVRADQLPRLVSPKHIGQLSHNLPFPFSSKLMAVPLIIGASDGALANLGSGAVGAGRLAVTIGTSAAIRRLTDTPQVDDAMRTFCYRLDEHRCIVGGASNNGGNVLEWLRTIVFRSTDSAQSFADQAKEAPVGANGLICLPYLQGERAPLWDAKALGAFMGLTIQHGQPHFIRSAMEGILFNLKNISDSMNQGNPMDLLHASGGFSQNAFWVQMLADIFQIPVQINDNQVDAALIGAVQLGRLALDLAPIDQQPRGQVVTPIPGNAVLYQEAYDRFYQYLQTRS